ncbi:hypothetical protein FQA39_LY15663 [Lamprigera yunnana]|nr:hypothetical protein FQA39_LY15663 [Lamprigera yunnana]
MMVRTYIRKTQRGAGINYSEEDLQKAIEDVRNGIFWAHVAKDSLQEMVRGGGGVESFLSAAEEEEIVNCLKVMDKNGFGLSRHEVWDLVQLYIRHNNIPCRFKDQRPGIDGFIAFRIRHRLLIKKVQSIEHVKCDQINPWLVYNFFEVLAKTCDGELG